MFKTGPAWAKTAIALIVTLFGGHRATLAAEGNQSLVINEVMASNSAAKKDPQGQFDDWIEIYNTGDAPVDLGGLYLSDDVNSPTQWQFPGTNPSLTTIAPQGYLLIWADGDTQDQGLHANFKLDSGGETVALFASDGATLIDSVAYPKLDSDVSYGRSPDANDGWQFFGASTPGAKNAGGYAGLVAEVTFSHAHGFYTEAFSVTLASGTQDAAIYYSVDGSEPGTGSGKTRSGTLYANPIPISKTTCLRAAAIKQGWRSSAIGTATYLFVADVLQQSPTGAKPGVGWPEPTTGGGRLGRLGRRQHPGH